MSTTLSDFPRAAAMGFESGRASSVGNPLGQFVKGMLQAQQQRQQVQGQAGMERGMADYKQSQEQSSPLYQAQVKATQSLSENRQKPDIKELAIAQVGTGQPFPGFTLEETKKIALGRPGIEDLISTILGVENNPNETSSVNNPLPGQKPKYNPKTQKLQQNKKTGEWRVVNK